MPDEHSYGHADATFRAAGGEAGIRKLVNDFYEIMATRPQYQTIWNWHPGDGDVSRDKLAAFLCGWMGGPRRYSQKYGAINIPGAHSHLVVTEKERDQWLNCMTEALARQDYPASLKTYLAEQLAVPAGRILEASRKRHQRV